MNMMIRNRFAGIIGTVILLFTCCKKLPQNEQPVYENNFEQSDLSSVTGGLITDYNGSKVFGRDNK
ncbi:MAG TPA: hypothetical protein DIT07_03845, partial [Sphingobacteriaceae bacterium]|nr:hypothetical protein [Sphingobacteriaceae bacterium]